jgi:hypothetical protein
MEDIISLFQQTAQISEVAGPSWPEIILAVIQSFLLASIIGATYKLTYRGASYSQDYVHTLIILCMGVAVVMMVVRGNPAMAFGMFAAFSIIRFRRSVGQSRDIGFVFLAMAAGMAIGARQYILAWATVIVITAIIYLFSKADAFAPRRVSHFLRLRVTNDVDYDSAFQECFSKHLVHWNVMSIESVQAGLMTELRMSVTLREPGRAGAFISDLQLLNGNNRILLTSAAPEQAVSD